MRSAFVRDIGHLGRDDPPLLLRVEDTSTEDGADEAEDLVIVDGKGLIVSGAMVAPQSQQSMSSFDSWLCIAISPCSRGLVARHGRARAG